MGQNYADPAVSSSTYTYKSFADRPLFNDSGPIVADVAQGSVGDCYYLATLASIADSDPDQIRQSIVDLGDGTYAVQFVRGGSKTYVRVDGDLATWNAGSSGLVYAKLGVQGALWVPIMEKAYAYFRTSTLSYASLDSGWMSEAASCLGLANQSTYHASNGSALLTLIAQDLSAGRAVTYAVGNVSGGAPLIGYHAYSVVSVNYDGSGNVSTLTVHNPWGVDGAGNDGNNDGNVTITAAQAQACFLGYTSMVV